jgi:Domain of unknown function (DUF4145)
VIGHDWQVGDGTVATYRVGHRRCPDSACGTLVFYAWDDTRATLAVTYPPERLDFDSTNLPQAVLIALEEAIACHSAGCYVAAGMMVRKTLEELCEDRAAHGKNLKERIADLRSKVVLPQELLDGLDDLRLLGNDAAHIESKVFQQIGNDEVELSIEFTKEVLKALYQYDDLVTRLRALKKL